MYRKSIGFLSGLLFASLGYSAVAAPTVRMLGTNNSDTVSTATPVRDVTGVSTTRKSSLPLKARQTATLNKTNTISSDSSKGRLSVIKNLSSQNSVKYVGSSGTSGSGNSPLSDISKKAIGQVGNNTASNAAVSELINKVDNLADKVDSMDLSNYYTKPQVNDKIDDASDEINNRLTNEYYTSQEIDEKLSEIQGDINNVITTTSAETIQQHTTQIQELQNQYETIQQGSNVVIHDPVTDQPMNDVSVVNDFDEDGFQWEI